METFLLPYFVLSLLIGIVIAAKIGEKKTVGFGGALLLCILLSPIIGGVITYLSKDKQIADLQKRALINQSKDDLTSKLEKLANLKQNGLITDSEYKKAKDNLLS
jgi:hypothetical protein